MIRDNLILDLNDELLIDNFAGGGGASTGIELALGRHVDHAINHDKFALGMHRINHPQTVHHPEDVFAVNPARLCEGRHVGLGWFSPDCKHFSKAKGGKPLSKKIRGLAFVMFRWARYRVRVMYMENVEEIQGWGPLYETHSDGCRGGSKCKKTCHYGRAIPEHKGRTWRAFIDVLTTGVDPNHPDIPEMLEVLTDIKDPANSLTKEELVRGFGYDFECREIRACDKGAPTIRKRMYAIMRCDGMPIIWPEDTHADLKAEGGRRKAEKQYELVDVACKGGESRLKPYRIIAECIDWHLPVHSIFLTPQQAKKVRCRRPLAKSTLKRIATGIDKYVLKAEKAFIVTVTHQGADRLEPVDQPMSTITGAHRGEKAFVDATVAPTMMVNTTHHTGAAMDESAPTIPTGGHHALVKSKLAPFITEHANASSQRNVPADKPSPTLCAEVKGGHFASVAATLVGAGGPEFSGKPKPADKPHGTLVTENHTHLAAASMVKMRGTNIGSEASEPVHAISAGGQHHGVSFAYLAQHNAGFNSNPGHAATEPISTISGKGSQQQLVTGQIAAYYGNDKEGQALDESARTVTTRERFGLGINEMGIPPLTEDQIAGARQVAKFLRDHGVEFEGEFATVGGYVIVDIGMRMLTARELFRAQGFPESYIIDRAWIVNPKTGEIEEVKLTKEQQIRMCGNSVCPPVAEALVRANSSDLAIWSKSERGKHGRSQHKTKSPINISR